MAASGCSQGETLLLRQALPPLSGRALTSCGLDIAPIVAQILRCLRPLVIPLRIRSPRPASPASRSLSMWLASYITAIATAPRSARCGGDGFSSPAPRARLATAADGMILQEAGPHLQLLGGIPGIPCWHPLAAGACGAFRFDIRAAHLQALLDTRGLFALRDGRISRPHRRCDCGLDGAVNEPSRSSRRSWPCRSRHHAQAFHRGRLVRLDRQPAYLRRC